MTIPPVSYPIRHWLRWQNTSKMSSTLHARRVFQVVFLRFILLGSFRNRFKTFLLYQEMSFKKNLIEIFYFFVLVHNFYFWTDFVQNLRAVSSTTLLYVTVLSFVISSHFRCGWQPFRLCPTFVVSISSS